MANPWEMIKGGVTNGVNGYLKDRMRNGDYSVGDAVVADLASLILNADIVGMCNFNDRMYMYMNRLMQININEKNIRFYSNGNNAANFGQSDILDPEIPRYSYVEGLNYLNSTDKIRDDEMIGTSATQQMFNDYRDNKNIQPKDFDHGNLYPDDINNLQGKAKDKKWRLGNPDSIIFKTKKLFDSGKVNTIISKFGTNTDGLINPLDYKGIKSTRYGESHGRNLLKAGAEKRGTKYDINGYNNPYCRVWTHHYKYDRYDKTIRPFYQTDSNGNVTMKSVKEIHSWGSAFEQPKGEYGYGWKNGDTGWERSVLDTSNGGDGILKIAPKYINGGKSNIHTKDCMFSIENLAWRGYDPYSFEKALSWEQRGPLGGRIMWFPPYGIEFNETTSVNWSSNTFIGRGEDVYTYVNTQRSGTLSFLMVVDHPSIIDYATWHDENENFKDTDMLRFFAGCDPMDPGNDDSIMSIVKPTPLTDEYLAEYVDPVYEHPTVNTPPSKPGDPKKDVIKVTFYAFYPNNYSGKYDNAGYAVSYLLSGAGAGKYDDGNSNIEYNFKSLGNTDVGYEMKSNGLSTSDKISDLNEEGNYIYAFAKSYDLIQTDAEKDRWRWYYRVDGEYSTSRSDVENTYGQRLISTSGGKVPTPTFSPSGDMTNTNYTDIASFGLNASTANWESSWKTNETEENVYCSLADFAYSVAMFKGYKTTCDYLDDKAENGKITVHNDKGEEEKQKKCDYIKKLLTEYKITQIDGIGYSNSHGYNQKKEINKKRNNVLAENRIQTIANWIKGEGISVGKVNKPEEAKDAQDEIKDAKYKGGVDTNVEPHQNSAFNAKLWRSAKITITFETDVDAKLAEANGAYEKKMSTYHKYTGYSEDGKDANGHTKYNDEKGQVWIELSDGNLVREDVGQQLGLDSNGMTTASMRGRSQSHYFGKTDNGFGWSDATANGKRYYTDGFIKDVKFRMKDPNGNYIDMGPSIGSGERNKLRYDQEYYFFRTLEKKDPVVFNRLMDKIKYFDPAFHSMTPEGFNARLTFLNQCTRQGNTISMSDINGRTANNLAFGRPPFCVLRLGDFYNQMIVIDSVNIDYNVSDGIQWDMNTEGIGMQPLLARVSLSFKFIGGSDIAGPIRRLQNAMSFNYYANARFYDNRADRIKYKSEDNYKEIGGGDHNYDVDKNGSYAYITNMYNKQKKYSDEELSQGATAHKLYSDALETEKNEFNRDDMHLIT